MFYYIFNNRISFLHIRPCLHLLHSLHCLFIPPLLHSSNSFTTHFFYIISTFWPLDVSLFLEGKVSSLAMYSSIKTIFLNSSRVVKVEFLYHDMDIDL